MRVQVGATPDRGEWSAFIEAAPGATFYHRAIWMESLVAAYPYYKPFCLLALDERGRLAAGLPAIRSMRAGLSQILAMPYGTYGTPLVSFERAGEREELIELLRRAWLREARRPGVVRAHLVHYADHGTGSGEWRDRLPRSWRREESTHLLDLRPGFEELWHHRFSGDRRTECRKAERNGVTVADETTGVGAATLADLYREQSRAWTNHTPVPESLFRHLVERSTGDVQIWVARRDGRALSAEMIFVHGGVTITWMKCNTPEARQLGAGTLLYKSVIEAACRRGDRTFNLGGTQGRSILDRFKEGFGTEQHPYESFLYEPAWFRPIHRLYYRSRGIREPAAPPDRR